MTGSSICRSLPQEAFSERLIRSTTKSGGMWLVLCKHGYALNAADAALGRFTALKVHYQTYSTPLLSCFNLGVATRDLGEGNRGAILGTVSTESYSVYTPINRWRKSRLTAVVLGKEVRDGLLSTVGHRGGVHALRQPVHGALQVGRRPVDCDVRFD
jgi:hypothetical protein